MTLEEAMRKVAGVLMHPSFGKTRPDVVITPGPNRTVLIGGPRQHLDGFLRPLQSSGLEVHRPAPAMLSVLY